MLLLPIMAFLPVHPINVVIEASGPKARTLLNTANVGLAACKPSLMRPFCPVCAACQGSRFNGDGVIS